MLRSAIRTAQRTPDRLTRLQQWAITTATHRGRNKATIALANKLARIVWAVWCRDEDFQARPPLTTVAEGGTSPDEVRSEQDTHGMTGRTGTETSRKRR